MEFLSDFFLLLLLLPTAAAVPCASRKGPLVLPFCLWVFFLEEAGSARAQKVSPVSSVDLQKCNSISAWPSPFSGFRVAFFLVAIAAAAGCFPTFWPPFCLQQTDRLSHGRKTVACLPWAGLQTSTGSSAQGAELTSIPNIKALSIEYPPTRGRSPWSLCCPCPCQRTVRLSSFAVCGNYRFRFFAKKRERTYMIVSLDAFWVKVFYCHSFYRSLVAHRLHSGVVAGKRSYFQSPSIHRRDISNVQMPRERPRNGQTVTVIPEALLPAGGRRFLAANDRQIKYTVSGSTINSRCG